MESILHHATYNTVIKPVARNFYWGGFWTKCEPFGPFLQKCGPFLQNRRYFKQNYGFFNKIVDLFNKTVDLLFREGGTLAPREPSLATGLVIISFGRSGSHIILNMLPKQQGLIPKIGIFRFTDQGNLRIEISKFLQRTMLLYNIMQPCKNKYFPLQLLDASMSW